MVKTNGLLKTQAYEECNIKNKILVINILSVPSKALLILIAKLFILRKNKIKSLEQTIGSLDRLFSTKLINQLVPFLWKFCNRILSYHIFNTKFVQFENLLSMASELVGMPPRTSPPLKIYM